MSRRAGRCGRGAEPTTPGRTLASFADERGSTLPLVFGFALLALAVVLVVASASSLYLERKRLLALADGAALAAADAWAIEDAVAQRDGVRVEAEQRAMQEAADGYLAQIAPRGVALAAVESRDGTSATVRLRGLWRAPVSSELLPIEVELEVESTARSVFSVPAEPE
ncbi:pilus assembly protein TadG-related protein [Agromyces sp. NBRC 114283]|uniref:pilus assembly protein TadG-related protein n=1 Tax=Agromyces sp. NBRC 114283 TaxID=2994521 RepID=UPI0024A0977B|nr:pilus assembly protein TadG-related protein [Agromyces sp. NBRC 114283]GLU89616.1 hypothetical protein Agsp01_18710 [Agromyces sp. NBRC 114283]